MKNLPFKFDVGDEITTFAGQSGVIIEQRRNSYEVRYLVLIASSDQYKKSQHDFLESELIAGQATYIHERK